MELREFLNSKDIALYIEKLPEETTLDSALFPDDKQLSMELEQAKGADGRVKALRISTFDVASKKRALNAEINLEKYEMPFFKESIGINEKQRRDIIQAQQSGNQNLIEFLMKKVFNNYADLVNGALVQSRRMRAQVIQNGKINISTDDGNVVLDYGVPKKHKETITDAAKKWNVETADIIGDILRWQKIFVDEGKAKPTRLVMTEITFNSTICINKAIKADMANRYIAANATDGLIITQSEFITYLKNRFDIEVGFVNGQFINESGEDTNYYEDGKVSFIPTGTLGKTVYSVTPEEYDKSFGSTMLDTSVVKTGIAITTMVNEDPVTVDTKVSQIVLPSFERANEVFLAKVY